MVVFKRNMLPRWSLSLALLLATLALSGCNRAVKPFIWDPAFSINVAEVNHEWPQLKEDLSPAEREVYDRYGRPDYVHVIWSRHEPIVDRTRGNRLITRSGKKPEEVRRGWIYLKHKKEIIFNSEIHYEIQPLTGQLEVLTKEGDPPWVKVLPNDIGARIEKWQYIDRGIIYTFVDNKLHEVDKSTLTPMPGYRGGR
ncbi:MAG: hypothetical protein ACOC29_02870 [Candidatus Sumerlaeota bacterium]